MGIVNLVALSAFSLWLRRGDYWVKYSPYYEWQFTKVAKSHTWFYVARY